MNRDDIDCMITLTREEAQKVPLVELLESVPEDARMIYEHSPFESENIPVGALCREAAKALRARLSAPEPEPVAWLNKLGNGAWIADVLKCEGDEPSEPLYTAAPQREWQGLTDEEAAEFWYAPVAVIEAKLREKNA